MTRKIPPRSHINRVLVRTATMPLNPRSSLTQLSVLLSGSAFPATLAFQIREVEKQTGGNLKLDAIVTVIDAENFVGYEDQSPTARMQASYTDIILIVSFWFALGDTQSCTQLGLEQMGTCF